MFKLKDGSQNEDFGFYIKNMLADEGLPFSTNVGMSDISSVGSGLDNAIYSDTEFSDSLSITVHNRMISYSDGDYEIRQYGTPYTKNSMLIDSVNYVDSINDDTVDDIPNFSFTDSALTVAITFPFLSFPFHFITYEFFKPTPYSLMSSDEKDEANYYRAAVHAKNMISELVRVNHFTQFWTLTFDPKKVNDRFDDDELIGLFRKWIKKVRRRDDNKFKYLAIPERHENGAIHFHVFADDNLLSRVDTGKRYNGKISYVMPDWPYGFSTSIDITGPRIALANYVTKYVTKSFFEKDLAVKPRYIRSRGLNEAVVDYNVDISDYNVVPSFVILDSQDGSYKYKKLVPDNGSVVRPYIKYK